MNNLKICTSNIQKTTRLLQ